VPEGKESGGGKRKEPPGLIEILRRKKITKEPVGLGEGRQ